MPMRIDRDVIARAIYETDPYVEPGETIDGFEVSPRSVMTWNEAKGHDAKFHTKLTEFAFACADAVLKLSIYD
jgi:hypothetical protein